MFHNWRLVVSAAGSTGLMTGVVLAGGTSSFHGIGDLPGSDFYSQARGVSDDGSVVVGLSDSGNGTEAFSWTAAGGIHGLGDLAGGNFDSNSWKVSGDGSVVVGTAYSSFGNEGFRTSLSGPMQGLGFYGNFGTQRSSEAIAVSHDGSVIAGVSTTPTGNQAVRWTSGGIQPLGYLPGGTATQAWGMSADGGVVCGQGNFSGGSSQAFRWTQAGAMQPLGFLPGGSALSGAFNVSADGSAVVGFSSTTGGQEAFRWTQAGGMLALGDLPGGTHFSVAYGSNADGSVIAGISNSGSADSAFVWTSGLGMISLRQYLTMNGVTGFENWSFTEANCISPDGTAIVGYGINPQGNTEGFVAVVPAPGASAAIVFGLALMRRRR